MSSSGSQFQTDQSQTGGPWRVDFSLAIFNRSGKYQIGREIIDHNAAQIDGVWYWRRQLAQPPTGLVARLLGKAEKIEHDVRLALRLVRGRSNPGSHRWLHLDPLTVLHRPVAAGDIVLVHDLGPLTHPHLFTPGVGAAYKQAYQALARSEAMLVFVSKDSARQYAKFFGEPTACQVIYPPVAARLREGNQIAPENIAGKYLLTVGAVGLRKNQARSIKAFAASGLADDGYEYVLCGGREPGHEDVTKLADKTKGVRLLEFVDDAELRWLYANAAGFVLPSLLEGFGMPVAEALAFGLIPIISRDTVLTEVAGSAAIGVDPENVSDIAAAMRHLTQLPKEELAERRAAAEKSLARFSQQKFLNAWSCLLAEE